MDPFAHFDTLGFVCGKEVVRLVVMLAEVLGGHSQKVAVLGKGRDVGRGWKGILGDGSAFLKREFSVLEDRRLSQYRSTRLLGCGRSETRILAIVGFELVVKA